MEFKITEETYKNGTTVYRLKIRHPWFPIWMYIGRAADRMFFTTMNDYQTAYHTYEDACRRVYEYKAYIERCTYASPTSTRVCKTFKF